MLAGIVNIEGLASRKNTNIVEVIQSSPGQYRGNVLILVCLSGPAS